MYIRTKNKIYQVESTLRDNGFVKGYNVGYMAFITKDQVINQSENLEELCDEFVLYDNNFRTYGVFDKKVITFKWLQNHLELYKGMTIYGCIWTSKGLIYVAKMNENGELVLI